MSEKKYSYLKFFIICITFSIVIAAVSLYIVSSPMAWILGIFALCFFILSVSTKAKILQYTLLSLFTVCFSLLTLEIFLELRKDDAIRLYDGSTKSTMYAPDELLGFVHKSNFSLRMQKIVNDELLYDTIHSTDEHGRRSTPLNPQATTGIFFFGCSMTDGIGVSDTQEFPYKVAELLGPNYQVYNMAVGGYGTHQFLALLESDRLKSFVNKYQKVLFFFWSFSDHPRRVAGLVEWSMNDPRFILTDQGVIQDGNFALQSEFFTKLWQTVKKSNLFNTVVLNILKWKHAEMNELNDAIILKATQVSKEKYHAPLTIILGPEKPNKAQEYNELGMTTIDLATHIPQWPNEDTSIPKDGHPTAKGHSLIADVIADFIKKD